MIHAICRPLDRITHLDVLAGLVLPGLLIVQVFGRVQSVPLTDHPAELPVYFMVQLLVNGQFDRMGSFLFGLGFYRCWQQTRQDGPGLVGLNANRNARRLLLLLLGIGLIFSLLLRQVDLLAVYALLGFTLLYFRNQSVSSLLTWIVGLAGLVILVPSCLGFLHFAGVTRPSLIESPIHCLMTSFRPGLRKEALGWQPLRAWLLTGRSVSQGFSSAISYEMMMLGGLLVGKLGMWHRDLKLRVRLALLQFLVFPVALLFKGTWVVVALGLVPLPLSFVVYKPVILALSGFLAPSLLTVAYLLDVGLNVQVTPSNCASWIGRVGHLGLSHYVLQSIFCTLFLSGYGFAVLGPLTFWGKAVIVVGIYAFQVGSSRLWPDHCRQGPLEWVCRQWIYD